jgi:cytochrome c553
MKSICVHTILPLFSILTFWGILENRVVAQNAQTVNFSREVQPLLARRCFACHGPDKAEGGLRMNSAEGLSVTLDSGGQAVVAGKPDESEVIQRITSTEEGVRMPPEGKPLTETEQDLLRRWIEEGGKFENHWAFEPVTRPEVPASVDFGSNSKAVKSNQPIDRFIDAKLNQVGLSRAAPAQAEHLLRRLYYDLTGLPPTPQDVDEYLKAYAANPDTAYENEVDKLLASERYGEKWARHWLDVVRYAETNSFERDGAKPHVWRYRDYVIGAFNQDKPYNEFIREQLAGDEIQPDNPEMLIAAGFLRMGPWELTSMEVPKIARQRFLDDVSNSVGETFLAHSLQCARCHDHKFDPITQKEFYQLASFFADIDEMQTFKGGDTSPTKRFPEMDVLSPLDGQTSMRVMVSNSVEPRPIRVLPRGNWLDESGEVVTPTVPATLPAMHEQDRRRSRSDLAHWLFGANQALTARVTVNRLWTLFYGRGLSTSLDDYGSQGTPPTHPELLDWLAQEWIDSNWDIKHLVRLMVQANAYRRTTWTNPNLEWNSQEATEKAIRLHLIQSPRRIAAEFLRDAVLQVSGLMDKKLGGPPVRPYQPDGYYNHLNFPPRHYVASEGGHQYRRGLYTHWQRQFLHPMLKNFDAPSREECTAQRNISNTPTQMLVLLNDTTFVEAARALAWQAWQKTARSEDDRDSRLAQQLWQLTLSRPPTLNETRILLSLYREQFAFFQAHASERTEFLQVGQWRLPNTETLDETDLSEIAAWSFVARSLFILNESITLY